jgi:uncharacterized protein DUF5676
MIDVRTLSWSLSIFGVITFVVCILYGLVAPPSLHMAAGLEVILPGFVWLTPLGFLIGLVESFAYGAYAGLVFAPVYNRVHARFSTD